MNGVVSGVSATTTTTNTNTMKNNSALTATANNSSNNPTATSNRQKVAQPNRDCHYSGYPKPAYSNACLIALGMLNVP